MAPKPIAKAPTLAVDEAIRLSAAPAAVGGARWGAWLVAFMRAVAALWIVQGLVQWNAILGPGPSAFEALPTSRAAVVGFFAVGDLVAAVGLWAAAPWGAILWIVTVAAQMLVIVALPDFFPNGRLLLGVDVALVVAYFVLTWYAANEAET